jgi:hypothetical protein
MKPAEMLKKTQKRLSKEIEMRERTIEVLQVLQGLAPDLDIDHACPSSGPLHSTVLELSRTTFNSVELLQDVLQPIQLLMLHKEHSTTAFVPGRLYEYTTRFAGHAATRIMPCIFCITSGVGWNREVYTPKVIAEWWIDVSDFTVQVKVQVEDHGFSIHRKKDKDTGGRSWVYEPPPYMDGYDHIQWWNADPCFPADRTYFRLAAHGWDG